MGSGRNPTSRTRVEVAGQRPPPILTGSAPSTVREIVGAIRQGAVVAIPTDTVYGIAAALDKPEALDRVFDIKGRPRGKPLPVLVSAVSHIGKVSVGFDEQMLALAARFWPGALTIVVPARPDLPTQVLGFDANGGPTVGVRLPAQRAAIEIIDGCGGALAVTSANRSGEPPARTPAQARAALGSAIDAVVDGGDAPNHLPSTIVTVAENRLLILREGGITDQDLAIAWDEIGRAHR